MSAFVARKKGITFSDRENLKYSTSFQSPSCTLPTGGKGIEQEIFSFNMQILRTFHLQLACLVCHSWAADLQGYKAGKLTT
jgi:hypothetical protein